MTKQVRNALFKRRQILLAQHLLIQAAVHLEGTDRGHNDHRIRNQSGHAALYVQELLRPQIRTESGLSDRITAHAHGHLGGHHAVAAMRDIGKRSAMHKSRRPFQCLHQIGLQRILEQGRHGTGRLQVIGRHRTVIIGVGNDDPPQAFLKVVNAAGQTEHRHDFTGHRDIKSILPGYPVGTAAQSVHHETQLTVVHVHAPLPDDFPGIDAQRISLLDVIVQHRRQQVVCRPDGMEVTGKVQVDILHGHHLGISAAGGTALDAEHRAKAGFTERHRDILADAAQAVRQTDGGGGFALACRGRGNGRHQNQFAGFPVRLLNQGRIDLGLVPPVWLHIFLIHMRFFGNLANRSHPALLSNLNIT